MRIMQSRPSAFRATPDQLSEAQPYVARMGPRSEGEAHRLQGHVATEAGSHPGDAPGSAWDKATETRQSCCIYSSVSCCS